MRFGGWLVALGLSGGACGCTRAPEPPPPAPSPRPVLGSVDGEPLYPAADGGLAVIGDGGAVLQRGARGWEPVVPPGKRIELNDGSYWLALGFTTDGTPVRTRWISPSHPKSEIEERRRELDEEAHRLPPTLLARVQPELDLMALISTLEGRFADPATRSNDTAASVGIFQWAAERRNVHAAGTTLGRFFSTLAKRAAKESEPLYSDAWKQCRELGLSIDRGDLLLGKKRLSGGDLESRLSAEVGRGALRTYQLVAALDWIDDVKQTVVRPGVRGASAIGHDYAEAEHGRLITLKWSGHTLELRPLVDYTVGDFFHNPAALATAVSLGVNRPRYVETALWQARVDPEEDAKFRQRVDELLISISGPPDRSRYRAEDLKGDSARAYSELQSLVWPAPDGRSEAELERAFTERALALYRPAERERRAKRLATGR